MISCPKCGFQQPLDKFCAKCGVDIQSFRPKASIQKYMKGFAPLVLVIIGVFLVSLLFKRVERQMQKDLNEQARIDTLDTNTESSTQIGVKAESLATNNSDDSRESLPTPPKKQTPVDEPSALAANIQPATDASGKFEKKPENKSETILNQVRVDYVIAELNLAEQEGYDPAKTSFSLEQVSPLNSFYSEQLTLGLGPHSVIDTSEDPQESFKLSMRLNIESVNSKEAKIKIALRREIAIPKTVDPTNSITYSETVPLNRYFIILDRLPRTIQNFTGSSILSSLMQSQLFLTQQSELVHILRFHSPTQEPTEQP